MKIKTSELTGSALDWAVAKYLGGRYSEGIKYQGKGKDAFLTVDKVYFCSDWMEAEEWHPSSNWSQGGPLLGTLFENYSFGFEEGEFFVGNPGAYFYGDTALIAAMRCLVGSTFGDETEVPEDLL